MFFLLLVRQYATSLIELLLDRFKGLFRGSGVGVTDFLEKICDADEPPDFEVCWSSTPATILKALRTGNALAAQRAAAEVMFHACARRTPGDWEIRFDEPMPFLWDSWLLPEADRLIIQSDGSTARILAGLNGGESEARLYWSSEQKSWLTDDLKRLHRVADREYSASLLSNVAAPDFNCDSPVVSQITSANCGAVTQAIQLLRGLAPEYYTWVTRVVRRLVIVEAPPSTLRSGNLEGHYGTFYISSCSDPVSVAEMLVHESSHQYYHILTTMEDVTDKSDPATYYSPFVRRLRTLDRILVAYHAFANVYLFYQKCSASKEHDRRDRRDFEELVNDVRAVEKIVIESDKLTPVGRAIAEPLYQEMRRVQ
jgi:hypothetical protein